MIESDRVKIFRGGLLKLISLSGQLKSGEQIADDNERLVAGLRKGLIARPSKKPRRVFGVAFFIS